jgi:3-hydroxyacyl-[acyl-carrier-protein] dehydratase
MSKILTNLHRENIQTYQQNIFPFLYIDFLSEVIIGKSAKGYKKFLIEEWEVNLQNTIPCFVISEACEHAFLMTFLTMPEYQREKTNTLSLNIKFFKDVHAGQQLDIIANVHSIKRGIIKGESKGFVNNELVCKINVTLCLPKVMNLYKPKSK